MTEFTNLPSIAEQRAANAGELAAFGGISLSAVRRDLVELLEAIKVSGFFEEYTKHDISHVDAMLAQLEWLIPADTQEIMTTGDWLLIVLSAYLHDLGMLITRDEYGQRESSPTYTAFRDEALNAPDIAGQEFAARIRSLKDEDLERFLYQEYVRKNHASRIKVWIDGRGNELGEIGSAGVEVQRLLSCLDPVFLSDLAVVCESHHLDDLDDTRKYRVDQPYGAGRQENANVQYAAVILRTMDLLHITRDRTPSVAFRIINPQDPISQREWARQQAVRTLRPKVAEDSEGNLNGILPRNTIEVFARYDKADDYFGLTSFLQYAAEQIRLSHEWVARSNKQLDVQYKFPWRYVDSSNVEAIGFLNRPFEFVLDQDKILELLTGHTLYNDSSVVLRELVQNSLDAVRLAYGPTAVDRGLIKIKWDSSKRTLEVLDNGTGMTQEIIEENFLRVGTSYYQDPRFQKKHPDFHPISRFGIGVLSTFMIADQVEVITCHTDEVQARRLQLRTVHGKYLVSLLDKSDSSLAELLPHGTLVRLSLRPSATIEDVRTLASHWIVIPGCRVEVSTDGETAVSIGYSSCKEALEASLASIGVVSVGEEVGPSIKHNAIRVIEGTNEGVSLAFAVQWSSYFKEWQFFTLRPRSDSPDVGPYVGTFVEGIRVQSDPPGFKTDSTQNLRAYADQAHLYSMCNLVGSNAPKTNVARSDFELTDVYRDSLSKIYGIYSSHVIHEMRDIQNERGLSITWAAWEAEFLARPIQNTRAAVYRAGLIASLSQVPLFVVEDKGVRIQESADQLASREEFWTLHGAFSDHVEYLLREMPGTVSFGQLLESTGRSDLGLPQGAMLCTRLNSEIVNLLIVPRWSISQINGNEENRRCEAKWTKEGAGSLWGGGYYTAQMRRWDRLTEEWSEVSGRYRNARSLPMIPISGVEAQGFSELDSAVIIGPLRCLLPDTP